MDNQETKKLTLKEDLKRLDQILDQTNDLAEEFLDKRGGVFYDENHGCQDFYQLIALFGSLTQAAVRAFIRLYQCEIGKFPIDQITDLIASLIREVRPES